MSPSLFFAEQQPETQVFFQTLLFITAVQLLLKLSICTLKCAQNNVFPLNLCGHCLLATPSIIIYYTLSAMTMYSVQI